MRYIMGVDGGGSKTYTVITDENGNKIGEGISGCGNYQMIGLEQALAHIKSSIDLALEGTGLTYKEIEFVQYGLAGADRKKDYSILRSGLKTLPLQNWDLLGDALVGLRLGSHDNVGVVLVCGSGTNAVGKSKDGAVVQTGGFGYLYGDAAGGNYMAVETFRLAVRSWDSREIPSILTKKVPRFFGFDSMDELINHFLDRQVKNVPGELTILLHEAADEGDQLAIQLLSKVGCELGIAANSVIKRIGNFGIDTIPVVLIGSIFQRAKNSFLFESLEKTIKRKNRKIRLIIPEMEPVYGAVLLGMDRLRIKVTPDVYAKFNLYRRALVE